MESLYSCEQVAERYCVKVSTVNSWIKLGKLPALKIGKLYRISKSDLDAFELAHRTDTKEAHS